MFYALLDLVACPACRCPLTVLRAVERSQSTAMRMPRPRRTNPVGAIVGPLPDAPAGTTLGRLLAPLAALPAADRRDREVSIEEAVLACVGCERWYPVRDGLPELLPDHLRDWDDDRAWLHARRDDWAAIGLADVWARLMAHARPEPQTAPDAGAHFKQAEMAVTRRSLPEGFFGPARVAPFNPSNPSFSMDLLARYVTTVSRLGCGINGMVFDLGCGYAWTTEWLVRLGYQAVGADICRDYILAGLPRLDTYWPHLIVADIENLPLRNECVDAVLSFDAFHHIPNRRRAMQHLARIMRPGAKMVLVEPGLAHEHHPHSIAAMQQHGILERGFDQAELAGYLQDTALGGVAHHRSDVHPHDIFSVQKAGTFETDSLSPRALLAELSLAPQAGRPAVGQAPDVTATIANCGDTVWLDTTADGIGEVHLGANLFDTQHTLLQEDYARIVLPHAVRPGQRITVRCSLPAVQRAGSYVVEFDMVDNGFLWFKDYAFRPVAWTLSVTGDAGHNAEHGPLVAERAGRIVPTEVSFEAEPVVAVHSSARQKVPLTQLPRIAWQVFTTEGLGALARKVIRYLR